jgi:GH24 family phage-related lysozyme (muramidase)
VASKPPQPSLTRNQKIGAAIGAAVVIAAPLTASFEGLRTKPYYDPAHILTVCYGETEREMRSYTEAECEGLLQNREAANYAPAIAKCVPGFADEKRRYAFAASIDASYNAGIRGFCNSRMARAFNAGDWKRGCDLFLGWRATAVVKGQRVTLRGLERRRVAERNLCLKGT